MSEVRDILATIRAARREAVAAVQGTPEAHMTRENRWGGGPMDVRFFHLRFADHDEEHGLSIGGKLADFGFQQTQVQRTLGAAEMTRGDLLGALVGLEDADLDRAPEGEWPLRQTLVHCLVSEQRYRANILAAVEAQRAGIPWERPEDPALVGPGQDELMDTLGPATLATFIDYLDAGRERVLRELSDLPDSVLSAPLQWAQRDFRSEFVFMRIAHHEREHTAHILKWREQVGRAPTEAQALLALGWRARGVIEAQLVGLPDELLDRKPSDDGWTIRELLLHLANTDGFLRGRIEGATEPQ